MNFQKSPNLVTLDSLKCDSEAKVTQAFST